MTTDESIPTLDSNSVQLTRIFWEASQCDEARLAELPSKFPQLTLQFIKAKEVVNGDGVVAKTRLSLSDGAFHHVGLVNSAERPLPQLQPGDIIRITDYDVHHISSTRAVLIVRDISVVGHTSSRVGDPRSLIEAIKGLYTADTESAKSATESPAPAATPAAVPPPAAARPRAPQSSAYGTIYAIEALSPYQNNWTIRARVTNKSDIRHYQNQRGEGKLFNVTFIDESGEIRATGFNDQVDVLYDRLQEGKTYYVSKCRVNIAKKQFSSVQNDFELMFERDTIVELCTEEVDLPQQRFNFSNIDALNAVEPGATVDFLGVLREVHEVSQITSKATGRPYDKRDLTLVDQSAHAIRCTVWGKTATDFTALPESVVALKGAKVGDFQGRNLSVLNSTTLTIDPEIPEAFELKGWYDGHRTDDFSKVQAAEGELGPRREEERKLIEDVVSEQLGMSEKPDYFTIKAYIAFVRKDGLTYPSCTQPNCIKKVIRTTDNNYTCEKCNVTMEVPQHRYIMSVNVSDISGQFWASCFDEVGNVILGRPADEIAQIAESGDADQLDTVLKSALFSEYELRCRARMDTYNDQAGVRYQILRASPVDFAVESERILKKRQF